MTAVIDVDPAVRAGGVRALWAGNPQAVVQRGLIAARSSSWAVVLSGFFEPVFYLLSMGIGLGALIGSVQTSGGIEVPYAAFIAPALLATSAMNGAIYDSTWNVFFKLNYGKLYEGMLATSLGPLDVALGEEGHQVLEECVVPGVTRERASASILDRTSACLYVHEQAFTKHPYSWWIFRMSVCHPIQHTSAR